MAVDRQVELAARGSDAWNEWRRAHPDTAPDLSGADLAGQDLGGADLSFTNLFAADLTRSRLARSDFNSANLMYAVMTAADMSGADFRQANLFAADLSGTVLTGCRFSGAHAAGVKLRKALLEEANLFVADISRADLSGAGLKRANFFGSKLVGSNLSGADCRAADLSGADLTGALLVDTDFTGATLSDCRIRGVTAAGLRLDGAVANDLVVTGEGEPEIAVDGFAAGLYLTSMIRGLESAEENPLTTDAVMLLGRYPHERRGFLNALREATRTAGFVPLLFDLDGAGGEDYSALVADLARLTRLVIADLAGTAEPPVELEYLAARTSAAIQPILAGPAGAGAVSSLEAISDSDTVRGLFQTDDAAAMIMAFGPRLLAPLKRLP